MSQQFFAPLAQYMGQLLDPRPVAEIVITMYETNAINYQIEGMTGPVTPETAYKMLRIVMQEIINQNKPTVVPQEVPQETPHE